MRRWWIACWVIVAMLSTTTGWSLLRGPQTAIDMTAAADAFLGQLTPAQKGTALLPFDDARRTDWHFIPKPTRKGLQVRDMSAPQRQAALALLRTALSETGYQTATKIMELELLLAELEKTRVGGPLRDAERYYFTIFSEPTTASRWGLSIEGHHLSLNFVVDRGRVVSSTPMVFAANPAVVKASTIPSITVGTRVLAREETLAFKLLKSLTAEQRQVAIIAEKAPAEIRAAGEAQPPQDPSSGLPLGKMNAEQVELTRQLLNVYAHHMPPEVAEGRLGAIDAAGIDQVHFAWAGADHEGVGHYYRLQGPTFLIEFVNVQPDAAGNPANHIHLIWRDMKGDFALPASK